MFCKSTNTLDFNQTDMDRNYYCVLLQYRIKSNNDNII